MIDHITNGIQSARADAWIRAPLIEATAIGRTIVVRHTLGVRANGCLIDNATHAIRIAWRWHTRIDWLLQSTSALDKRIADGVTGTRANRIVVHCLAQGAIATHVRTRIDAFIVDARFGSCTIGANHALRCASRARWTAKVARNTFAHGRIANGSAHRIHTARRWITWIYRCQRRFFALHNYDALAESVARCARRARANRYVIGYGARGFGATDSDAWILAFVADARFAHRTVRVAGALGSAAIVWIAMVVANAFANGIVVVHSAAGIVSARRWEARVHSFRLSGDRCCVREFGKYC